MAKKTIFCVGFDLPGDEFEYVPFESNRSLLDADLILFEPSLGEYSTYDEYAGKPLISEWDSPRVAERLAHWRSELINAVNAGKLVIIYLRKPIDVYRHTGRKEYSGTGRNQKVTNLVEPVRSYAAVPRLDTVVAAEGTGIKVTPQAKYLASYWKEVSSTARYEVYIEGKFTEVLLQTKAGERTLGAIVRGKGSLLFLPPIAYPKEKFIKYNTKTAETHWTADAIKFGKRLLAAIVGLADTLQSSGAATPPPVWASEQAFELEEERAIKAEIASVEAKLAALRKKRDQLESRLIPAGSLRALLYEQGTPLETAILEALRVMGFSAEAFKEGESEFDAVFISAEGRFLGEAEGKDTKAINIDKLGQLERNLQEDFQREEVTEYAKGVLFGNANRLTPPSQRTETFTPKCISGAKRARIALVRTPDLFEPVRYLKSLPDPEYARACRAAIFTADGDVVVFPTPPVAESVVIAEADEQSSERR